MAGEATRIKRGRDDIMSSSPRRGQAPDILDAFPTLLVEGAALALLSVQRTCQSHLGSANSERTFSGLTLSCEGNPGGTSSNLTSHSTQFH